MSAIKTYFKEEFKTSMLTLEHSKPADFYLCVWQRTRSVVPLLIFRTLLFLTSLGIIVTSGVIYMQSDKFRFWFIYLTHWGLTANLLATGAATVVSARCYVYGPISSEFRLPSFLKIYWILFNIATPLAFLITIFYWTLLYEAGVEEELNHGLDIAVHGLNSLVMLLMLLSSAHPGRLLHVFQPLLFGALWMIFSIIFYLAGGVNKNGEPYVYPVVDWADPGKTTLLMVITGFLLITLHLVTMGLGAARDAISRKFVNSPAILIEEGVPLRNRTTNV